MKISRIVTILFFTAFILSSCAEDEMDEFELYDESSAQEIGDIDRTQPNK
ncbi:MAG: hypothetical protein AAF363_17695 [Bacteroidota bacterium]